MNAETHSQLANFIWSICNLLRGPYKRNEYRKVILPLTVLRRVDCLLAPTKAQVLKEHAAIKAKPVADCKGSDDLPPFDAEPYGPGDSEYAAGQPLLARAVSQLGARLADYLVVDGEYSTAPFLHAVGRVGRHVVARLKSNLPELSAP